MPEGRASGHRLVELRVHTRHPQDYVLVNEADGTRWRGGADGTWKREDVRVTTASSSAWSPKIEAEEERRRAESQ